MTGDTEYQLVTLKRALGRNGVVCRLRTDNGTVRVDVFWSPPRMQRNLRPFTSMQPVALLQDFACNGFARVGDGALEDLAKAGILVASFASERGPGAIDHQPARPWQIRFAWSHGNHAVLRSLRPADYRRRPKASRSTPPATAGEPGWDRTIDLLIKSQLLYR